MTVFEKLTALLNELLFPDYDMEGLVSDLIANGVTVQKWIPVSKRMPNVGDLVLCLVKSFAFPNRKYYSLMRCDKYGFLENGIYTDDVTHWMPLPEPPSENITHQSQ